MIDKSNPKALEQHLADIKERLVLFSHQKPHGPELMAELREVVSKEWASGLDDQLIMAQDEFIHCRRLRCTNRRILDHFIETDKLLTEEDRINLDGYRDYHLGVLEVLEHREHAMLVHNLLNGWQGEIRANRGIEMFNDVAPVGSCLITALVYFGDDMWVSGAQTLYPDFTRQKGLEFAVSLARKTPSLVVRGNRERVREGFEAQAERHNMFVQYFGTDYFVCAPSDFSAKMEALERYCIEHRKGADGLTFRERCIAKGEPETFDNLTVPTIELPDDWGEVETLIVFSSPLEAGSMDAVSAPIFAALESGNMKAVMKHAKLLRRMIISSDTPPTTIRIMAGNFPELFGAALKQIFAFRTFDVARNLEPLLFKYKGMLTEPPRYPSIRVVDSDDPIYQALQGED